MLTSSCTAKIPGNFQCVRIYPFAQPKQHGIDRILDYHRARLPQTLPALRHEAPFLGRVHVFFILALVGFYPQGMLNLPEVGSAELQSRGSRGFAGLVAPRKENAEAGAAKKVLRELRDYSRGCVTFPFDLQIVAVLC